MNFLIEAVSFICGAFVGSLLNVCIWRMPRGESIVVPASHCPFCKNAIIWSDNIPILSFILLAGRCRHCGGKISFRYPLVEFLTALLFLANFLYFGISVKFFIYTALECALIVGTFTDLAHFIIPDEITVGGLALGLAFSLMFPQLHNVSSQGRALLLSFWGAAAGAATVYSFGFLFDLIYFKLLKKPPVDGKTESLGGGDVKLMAMIGSVLGWKSALLVFFIAPFFGLIAGIIVLIIKKSHTIPYAPYLSLAAFVAIMWGDKILKLLFYRLQ